MSAAETVTLTLRRRFDATPERVFDAWLEPDFAGRWLFRSAGDELVAAAIDARVGGRFRFVVRRDGEDVEHVGEYLVIERPRLLVFTFAVPVYSPEYDRVTVEIAADGQGCDLRLTTEMSPEIAAEWGEATLEGWTKMLGAMAALLAQQE